MGVIEPGDQEIYIKDSLSKTVNASALAVPMLCECVCVCVWEREILQSSFCRRGLVPYSRTWASEWTVCSSSSVAFLPRIHYTYTHTHTHTHTEGYNSHMQFTTLCDVHSGVFFSSDNSPHTALWVRSPADETRCSGSGRRAPGGCWCFHTYTGASAWASRTPGLRKHTGTHLLTTAGWISISQMTGYK